MNCVRVLFYGWMWLVVSVQVFAAMDFYTIRKVDYIKSPKKGDVGLWVSVSSEEKEAAGKIIQQGKNPQYRTFNGKAQKFVPYIEVTAVIKEQIRSDSLVCKAYFYGAENKVAGEAEKPADFLPGFLTPKRDTIFRLPVPDGLTDKEWRVLVVLGDRAEMVSAVYPSGVYQEFNFNEKELVSKGTNPGTMLRKGDEGRLKEVVIKTNNERQPQLTMFLMLPEDTREINGVMAVCLLAYTVEDIRKEMEGINGALDGKKSTYALAWGSLYDFARKNKMAVLAWGSRSLWSKNKNYDDEGFGADDNGKQLESSDFDQVADAWEKGVKQFAEQYHIPTSNYLLWGTSAAAQWSQRLVLRKPDYFLAVNIHIPGIFEKPVPAANSVLWLLTSGELDGGYENTRKYLEDCQGLNYPIIYKAIPNMGHVDCEAVDNLKINFFEYALTLVDEKEKWFVGKNKLSSGTESQTGPWPDGFREPLFYGNLVSQKVVPAEQKELVPEIYRIPLPSKKIAEAWSKGEN